MNYHYNHVVGRSGCTHNVLYIQMRANARSPFQSSFLQKQGGARKHPLVAHKQMINRRNPPQNGESPLLVVTPKPILLFPSHHPLSHPAQPAQTLSRPNTAHPSHTGLRHEPHALSSALDPSSTSIASSFCRLPSQSSQRGVGGGAVDWVVV
jgi:hypothetical protein